MNDVNLNLSRKWRARLFDHIIGQDLTVRILKNNLYVGNYFPVYLFWGQRGSGKTSTARVFAAATNCDRLQVFHKDPKQCSVPCLQCASCCAMLEGKHPDFIEIDAASHTGVDNVRQIIDAASLMPLLGRKKIYLIDEAHMLSKAAFNAFLKILEEPPSSVFFILATTDPEKIIDTVKSRCFQLFFKPIAYKPLFNHLIDICNAERISYEQEALSFIIKETDGSVRDALNLLEQVRFAVGSVSKAGVVQVLGHIDDDMLVKLFEILLCSGTTQLLSFLEKLNIWTFSAEHLWHRLILLIRSVIWLKHDLEPQQYDNHRARLRTVIQKVSLRQLTKLLERFYKQEPLFLKTTDKHLFLEILLLQICQHNDTTNNSNTSSAAPLPPPIQQVDDEDKEDDEYMDEDEEEEDDEEDDIDEFKSSSQLIKGGVSCVLWNDFLVHIERLDNPLLSSIFKQGIFSHFDSTASRVTVSFSKEFIFFNEWLDNSRSLWHPLLQKVFGKSVVFNPLFTLEGQTGNGQFQQEDTAQISSATMNVSRKENVKPSTLTSVPVEKRFSMQTQFNGRNRTHTKRKLLDVSDVQQWQKANLLLRYFPGVVSEFK